MGILAEIDALKAQHGAPAAAAPLAALAEQPSAFSRGLRAGVEDLTGQTRALLGQGAELFGANETAAEQRALSVANQQEGARIMEGLPQSYTDVRGLRDGWDYATGLIGRAGPGLVPMAIGGAVGGIPGMIAATAPSTIGAQFEAQQADPVQAAQPLAQRTLTGLGAGTAEATVMGIVPGLMGKKLFGKAAAGEAARVAQPFGRAVAENVPEAVIGNAAAGNVAARIGQAAETSLNPQRDTSQDEHHQMEATVGGAVMGAPFAALGTLGSMRGKKAPTGKTDTPVSTDVSEKPGKAPTFDEQLAGLKTALEPDLVTGREHADANITGDETVKTMAAKDAAGNAEATTKAQGRLDELKADPHAAKAQEKLDKLKADPAGAALHAEASKFDPASIDGQRAIGELYVKHRLAQKAKTDIVADHATLDAALKDGDASGARSNDYSGAERKVYEAMDGPEWADFSDAQKKDAAALVRKAVEVGEKTGRIPKLKAQRDVFGTDPVARLMRVYKVLDSGDPKARERFFGALDRMSSQKKRDDGLAFAVKDALPEHLKGKISDSQIDEFIAGMHALSAENLSKTMGANELKVYKTKIDDQLFDIFGADKAEGLIAKFAEHAKEQDKLVKADTEERAKIKSAAENRANDSEETTPPGEHATGEDGLALYEGERDKYYGRTPDEKDASPFVLNNLAHAEQFTSAESERPQNKRMARAQAENPDNAVRWVGAREYADATGMGEKELMAHTGGKPGDYGVAAARTRGADEHTLDDADLKAMSIGTHVKYVDKATGEMKEKHLAAPDSWKEGPSAIRASEGEHVFDATRIASWMSRKDGKNMKYTEGDDEHGSTYRTARAFAEGVAAINIKLRRDMDDAQLRRELTEAKARGETPDPDKLRRAIEKANDEKVGSLLSVPDKTVVVAEKNGKPQQTWGDLQQVLKDGKVAATAELAPLRAQRSKLYEARDAIHEKLDKSSELDLGAGDLANVRALMRQLETNKAEEEKVNKEIASVRSKHGLDREAWDSNDKTTAELEKDLSKLTIMLESKPSSEYLRRRVTGLEDTLERRAGEAQFNEAKELGDDSGTGRDAGSGIDLRREQLRVAESGEEQYRSLLNKLNKHNPRSPGEGAVWAREAEVVRAQLKTTFTRTPTDEVKATKAYRRMEGYLRIVEKRDRAQIEQLRDKAHAAADDTGKTFAEVDGKKIVAEPVETTGPDLAPRLYSEPPADGRRRVSRRPSSRGDTPLGVSEADPLGQIHQAVAEHKRELGAVAVKVRQKAGEYTEPAKPSDVPPITPEQRWATLNNLADDLAKRGKGGLRTLIDNRGIMSDVHQKELGMLVRKDGTLKSTGEIGTTLKAKTDMYSTDPRWSSTGEHAWTKVAGEGGEQHQVTLARIAKNSDPKALHTDLLELLVDKKPNEHKAKVIDALNERIGELVAKDPQAAYALQLKSTREGAGPPTPAQQAFIDRIARGGAAAKGVIDKLKANDDIGVLQRARRALKTSDIGSPHIDHAISTITDRLAQIDPEGARSHKIAEPGQAPAEVKPVEAKPAPSTRGPPLGERIAGVKSTNPYFAKDAAKARDADKFIGRGSAQSSTEKYRQAAGELANTGSYEAGDRVFVSVEGKRVMRKGLDTAEVQKALDAGATIIADSAAHRARDYNVGERELAGYLTKNGYVEKAPGEWTPKVHAESVEKTDVAGRVNELLHAQRELSKPHEPSELSHEDQSAFEYAQGFMSEKDAINTFPEEKRARVEAYVARSDAYKAANAALENYARANKEALSRHPDAMKNFVAMVKDVVALRSKDKTGSARAINADLMQQMFDHRGDAAWREAQIASKERRLAGYDETGAGKGLRDLIRNEIKLLKENDLQGMVNEAEKYVQNNHWRESVWPAPDLGAAKGRGKEVDPRDHFSREKQGTADSSAKAQADVHEYVNKVTGGDAAVNAAAKLLYAGSYIEGKDANRPDMRPIINVSVHALNPLSTAYHESLHWFADHLRQHGEPKVFAALSRAADSAYVRNFLRNKFKDQPDALKQVEGGVEERVAYMYQFHQNGELQLGTRGKTVLDHISDLINRVLGVWSNDARAIHIMDYFGSGKYADAMAGGDLRGGSAFAQKAMMEAGRNKTLDRLHANFKPLIDIATAVAAPGSAIIRDMGIPAMTKITDLVRLHGTQEGVDAGYLPAAGIARRAMGMELVDKMTGNNQHPFTFDQVNEAFAAISLKRDPKDAHQRRLMDAMRSSMANVHQYMRDAGVRIGDRGLNADYTPRVWDPAFIAGHQDQFRAMIKKYVDSGQFKGSADELMARLMRDEGTEIEPGMVGGGPGNQHAKTRELHFISAEDAAPFMEKDAMRVLSSYIAQSTRRAEWSRRFEQMSREDQARYDAMESHERVRFEIDRERPLDGMKAAAVKQGATPDQMALLDRYLQGVTGQLGSDVKPSTRKLFAQIMVYQNLRLLPLGFFSTLIDPVGVKVRGGTMGDVFNNFKRGILEIPRGFQKVENRKADAGYGFAEDLGVIDSAVLQHVMGAAYGLGAAGNRTRALNEMTFKWNLMDQMNTSQRVGATEAAMRFMLRHKDGDFSEHSLRYLGELGLKPADIKVVGTGKEARVAVRQEDFVQAGFNQKAALEAHLLMRQAVNRWVDGAVLRPDQSNKAIWMNDPLYALVAHMKQFSYAFQDTILKRVLHESRHGNYQPAVALAGYIPVMLAADLARGAVQSGGAQPDWKQGWDLWDYLANAIQRAGLFGVGQFAIDAVKDIRHGHTGIGALGGPTVSQLADVVATVGGKRSLEATVIGAMPANALWSGYLPGAVTHPGRGVGHQADTTAEFDSSKMTPPTALN